MRSLISIMFLLAISFSLSGCMDVKSPGKRTLTFGSDGITVVSDTVEGDKQSIVGVEIEKTRQVCLTEKSKADAAVAAASKDNPYVLAIIKQNEVILNTISLAITKKPYDPCPGSTNFFDVEIADSAMYTSMWHDFFDAAKFGLGIWGATEISSDIFGALAGAAGGYSFSNTGDGSINLSDSFNTSTIGAVGGSSNTFSGLFGGRSADITSAP